MRNKDRYFIFNHAQAFAAGHLSGVVWQDKGLTLSEGVRRGVFLTPVLDALERGNVWQRALFDLKRPDDTGISFRFYCLDMLYEAEALEAMLRDPETDIRDKLAQLERFKVFQIRNADDFLLRGVVGRYLVAAVHLYRRGAVSPVVSRMMIYAAQESFLSYLPEIFQEEGGFLDRYMRLFSVQYLDLEEKISRLPASFDPSVAPPGLLRWLAEIMGIPHIDLWETDNLRALLLSRVYARKGTLSGLGELIRIYTGFSPYIVESFRMQTGVGEMDSLYSGSRLVILMPCGSMKGPRMADALHLLIQSFIAQEISYKLIALENAARISDYAYLDVNAALTGFSPAVLEADSRIGYAILEG